MKPRLYLSIIVLFLCLRISQAQTYPFDLPEGMTATIDINTSDEEPYNNLLLGVNIHDLAHSDGQELVRDFDPITIRFPHGLFSNWYDWEQDKARVYGTDQFTYTKDDGTTRTVEISYLSSIKTMDSHNLYVGIDELDALDDEKRAATGKGYDMMWTFNMSADGTDFTNGSPVSVARYNDLVSRGFEVKAIEMGNENFYAGQRSSIIPNISDYIARAKSMYAALKAIDPELKLSVPLERKSVPANTGWNTHLTQTTDYFDAVSVHTYVGHDPDDPANGDEAYSTALTAREVLRKTVDNYSRVVAPDKPIWLTEWGVKSGGPNAVSALGMADCYLFMSENQDVYERANWFSVNGKLNSHLVWHEVNGTLQIKEPLEKTSYGSTYEIVRSVFENSTLLGSEITVPTLDGVVNAVSARAVTKDGQTVIFVLNLSDREVPFIINVDGNRFLGEFEHKTFAFSSMNEEISLPYHSDPMQLVKEGRGNVYLPKFSINTIVLDDKEALTLDFLNLNDGDIIDKGIDLSIEAAVGDEFQEVSLYVDNTLLSILSEAPYVWAGFPQLSDMMNESYILTLRGKTFDNDEIEKAITLNTPEQWAYTSDYRPQILPGIIEPSTYDYGGENVAWYDKSDQNTGSYQYRDTDKVDISKDGEWLKYIQGKEWLEYTVEVERSGNYDLAVKHETRRSPEFEAMSFSFVDSSTPLFSNLVCSYSGSGVTAIDTFSSAYMESGRHILRLDIIGYGWDMDYFEFILKSNPIDYVNVGTLNNSGNPESYDAGDIIDHLLFPLDSLGFNFMGWYTNSECTDTILVPAIAANENKVKVFYAKWSPKSLSGSAVVHGDIIEGNPLYIDTTKIMDNSGRLLYQWQRSNGAEFENIVGANQNSYLLSSEDVGFSIRVLVESTVQPGTIITSFTNTILDESATVLTITYDSNGGEDGMFTYEVVGVGGFPSFIAEPKREGYDVTGWSNAEGDIMDGQSVINQDTTLYALWGVKDRYKVCFLLGEEVVELYTEGYPALLPALPNDPEQADSVFVKWITVYGEPFDTSYLVFEDMEVYPVWDLKRFPLTIVSVHGVVTIEPSHSLYDIHTAVTLTAIPYNDYEFVDWTGDYHGTDTSITIVMDSAINLEANFESLPYYALDVYARNGSVSKFPNSSRYIKGFTVELNAIPDNGYEFISWSGDYVGTENPLFITMTEDMELWADFELIESSVQENSETIRVYPNPNLTGVFYLSEIREYKVISIAGNVMLAGEGERIDLSNYPEGIYFIRVGKLVFKVVYD